MSVVPGYSPPKSCRGEWCRRPYDYRGRSGTGAVESLAMRERHGTWITAIEYYHLPVFYYANDDLVEFPLPRSGSSVQVLGLDLRVAIRRTETTCGWAAHLAMRSRR